MKKLLIMILIVLLVVLLGYVAFGGVVIGNFELLSLRGIQNKDWQLNNKIEEATKLAITDYPETVNTITTNVKKLENEKTEYEGMVQISTDGEVQTSKQLEQYEVEYLWSKIGSHATAEGVTLGMDIVKGETSTKDTYDLKFKATGSYISVTDFISDIENDSSLGFKIEEFKMMSDVENSVRAIFTCKSIAIKNVSAISETEEDQEGEDTIDKDNTNTNKTNNTTSNTVDNTKTNTTNTTNTVN